MRSIKESNEPKIGGLVDVRLAEKSVATPLDFVWAFRWEKVPTPTKIIGPKKLEKIGMVLS